MSANASRVAALFEEQVEQVHVRRTRIFAGLMLVQWVCAMVLAFTYSPLAWVGRVHTTHVHVFTALVLGGVLSVPPILLAATRPGWVVTRHTMAICQMLWSALLIHLTGGRIETHFHVFGSLAFLAFYRDWKVLLTGTVVVAGEHLVRALVWPESVFGIVNPEWWRVGEHAFWVVFEDVVLVLGIRDNIREMRAVAESRAAMEESASTVEARVIQRTWELEASRQEYQSLMETTRTMPWRWHRAERRFSQVGPHAGALLGCSAETWLQPGFMKERIHEADAITVKRMWDREQASRQMVELEFRLKHDDGSWIWVRVIVGAEHGENEPTLQGIMLDVTDQRRLESDLNQAQKLESVGRLASGIAHEINTPIQFVNDSIHFISEAFTGLIPLLATQQALHRAALEGTITPALLAEVTETEEAADLEYLLENVPLALERSVDGLGRVATLVRSMKEFAHPDKKEKAQADLNRAIESTLVIARNEFKYVAEVQTVLGPLPPVTCHLSELNQVFLNIIVNASHAIGDRVSGTEQKGLIRVCTRALEGQVEISISDTGGGIPEEIRQKVFEPFFTTKAVGRGTGQGLAIARSVVVEKHGGTLTFETQPGIGTTFFIRIPCGALAPLQEAA